MCVTLCARSVYNMRCIVGHVTLCHVLCWFTEEEDREEDREEELPCTPCSYSQSAAPVIVTFRNPDTNWPWAVSILVDMWCQLAGTIS